jgi:hypothetical protein
MTLETKKRGRSAALRAWERCERRGRATRQEAGDKAGDDAGDEASGAGNDSGVEAELTSLTNVWWCRWRALPTRSWKIQRLQERRARPASKTGEQERRARTASKNGEQERRARTASKNADAGNEAGQQGKRLATRLETMREQERRARTASKSGVLRANNT